MWRLLFREIKYRLKQPIGSPVFILYFIIIIVAFGLAGVGLTIWAENFITCESQNHQFSDMHIILCIALYFIALLTSSAADLILDPKTANNELNENEVTILRKSLTMIGISSIVIGVFLVILALLNESVVFLGYCFASVGLIFSWFIWWITNSSNTHLVGGPINPNDAIGPPNNVDGMNLDVHGNLDGFNL